MKALAIALSTWSAGVIAGLLVYPAANSSVLDCMRLLVRSTQCETQQAAINASYWEFQTVPILVSIVAGYVGIAFVRAIGLRRSRRPRNPAVSE